MKLKYAAILLLTILFSLGAVAKEKGKPEITFKETKHDFGVVNKSAGKVSHIFEFTNTGDAPLVILSVQTRCGCTRPSYPKKPVNPGEKGEIKVTYLTDNYPGEFNKELKVKTNDPKHKKTSIIICGTVNPNK